MSIFDPIYLVDNRVRPTQEQFSKIKTSGITSREQIIDPYQLVQASQYGNNRVDRAQYESDLAQAIRIAEMQEASYAEWYNSEAQQIARQKAAGLNPDLNGTVESGGASDVAAPDGSPMDGIATNEEFATNAFNSLNSLIGGLSSVASLATSFSQLPLFKSQKDLVDSQVNNLELANITQFEKLAHNAISDKLSKAISSAADLGKAFDFDAWFSDDENFADIIPSYAPSDDARYTHALNRVRNGSQSLLSQAYSTSAATGQNKFDFASILANPYMESDVVLMHAQLAPVMAAFEQLRLLERDYQIALKTKDKAIFENTDPNVAASAINAENTYKSEYFSNLNGDEIALSEQRLKVADSILKDCSAAIYSHFKQIFEKDPTSPEGRAAAFMILSGAHMSWYEYLLNNVVESTSGTTFGSMGDTNGDGKADITTSQLQNRAFVNSMSVIPGAPAPIKILNHMLGF